MRVRRMFVIKIVSDPYRQQIQFQCWDDAAQHWQTIDDKNNDSSELVRTDIQKSFFPFQAERIVDLICEEYSSSQDKLALVFEGPPDEYADLQAVCALDKNAAQVALQPFQRKLENASTIWPCIARLAEDVRSRLVALGQHDAALDAFYRDGLVHVRPFGEEGTISANAMAGRDDLELIVCGRKEQTIVTALFDNLGKGACGAAIQNMNIMLGLDPYAGLSIAER